MKKLLLLISFFAGCSPVMAQYYVPSKTTINQERTFIKKNCDVIIKNSKKGNAISVKIWLQEQEQILMVEYDCEQITGEQFKNLDAYLKKMSEQLK